VLDYLPLVIFIAVALGISVGLLIVPFVIAYKAPDPEKLSAYECGFNAFDDARMKFDVRFYLVAILFIIFDLEMTFLFPWAVVLGDLGLYGYWSMMVIARQSYQFRARARVRVMGSYIYTNCRAAEEAEPSDAWRRWRRHGRHGLLTA
jgi:NADH-quinone oxidoreductase subunit A